VFDKPLGPQGQRSVPFFDAKAHVEEYVKMQHPSMTAAFPFPGSFYTNFVEFKLARYIHPAVPSYSARLLSKQARSVDNPVILGCMHIISPWCRFALRSKPTEHSTLCG
jgi:hypothetical protein